MARPAALREAITNLIFNAVDALPNGGTIRLTARGEGEQVVLEVRDSGTGIPFDVQSRVFDPFFTTKGERGTGLGLSQVTAIVKRHGGAIELRSTPSHGTTFRLKFPRAAASARRVEHTPVASRRRQRPSATFASWSWRTNSSWRAWPAWC